jgi:hypothetical protein
MVFVNQTPISHGRRTTISDIPVSEVWPSHAPLLDTMMNRGSLVGVGDLLVSIFPERYEPTRSLNGIAVSLWAVTLATLTRKIRFPAPQTRLSSGDSIRPATISVKGTKLTFTNLASGNVGPDLRHIIPPKEGSCPILYGVDEFELRSRLRANVGVP